MKLKRLLACGLAAVTLAAFPLAACVKREREPKYGDYIIPVYADDQRMRIGAWETWFDEDLTKECFQDYADAGFTLLNPLYPHLDFGGTQYIHNEPGNPERAKAILDRAYEAGLEVIINDSDLSAVRLNEAERAKPELNSVWNTKNVYRYIDHPAFAGLAIMDEPRAGEFTSWIKAKHDRFIETFGAGTKKWFWVNLYPSALGAQGLGAPTFKAYLDDYLRIVGGNVLSTDNYCLYSDNSVRQSFFSDLETARKAATKYNVPLNNFVLSIPHVSSITKISYKDPTEQDLRWQIAVSQTYGAESVVYYSYMTTGDGGGWVYGPGLVSRKGVKLAKWDYAKVVNNEALAWDHVYLKFKWQSTLAIPASHGRPYELYKAVQIVYDPALDTITGVKEIKSSDEVLLGEFKDADGNTGFMLTNATVPFEGKTAEVTIKFESEGKDGYKGVQLFERGVPRVIDLDGEGKAVIEVGPGEGKFLIPLRRAVL